VGIAPTNQPQQIIPYSEVVHCRQPDLLHGQAAPQHIVVSAGMRLPRRNRVIQPPASVFSGLSRGCPDRRIVVQVREQVLKDGRPPIRQFLVRRRRTSEVLRDQARGHGAAQRDNIQAAARCRHQLSGSLRDEGHDDRCHVFPPHRAPHVGHVALVFRRILHAQKEVAPSRDHFHFFRVRDVKHVVAGEHLLHVFESRNHRDILDDQDRLDLSQNGKNRLRIPDDRGLQPIGKFARFGVRLGKRPVHVGLGVEARRYVLEMFEE
jgi:hypothetical protein